MSPQSCPWCGRELEKKYLDMGSTIRHVCARCGFKIKEFAKPEPIKKEEKPDAIEVIPQEIPVARQKPAWHFILGAIVLILIIIVLVKVFLVP